MHSYWERTVHALGLSSVWCNFGGMCCEGAMLSLTFGAASFCVLPLWA